MFTPILLFIAFLLLLFDTLSVPIIKSIFLFKLVARVSSILRSSVSGSVKFGVWGYCVSPIDVSVAGFDRNTAGECSKAHLGYTFDSTVATALHVTGFEDLISKTLTAVLVLHPIACSLTFLALLASLFVLRRETHRLSSFITLGVGILAAFVTTLSFLIGVILVATVRHKVHKDTDGVLTLNWGNAVWMSLGATIAIWGAMVGTCVGICGRRNRKASNRY